MHRMACSRPTPPATVSQVPKLSSETSSGPAPNLRNDISLLCLMRCTRTSGHLRGRQLPRGALSKTSLRSPVFHPNSLDSPPHGPSGRRSENCSGHLERCGTQYVLHSVCDTLCSTRYKT